MYDIFEKLLKENGVTAYRVSKETGVSTATLTDWKKGRSKPKMEKLQKIADYFGVSVDYLIGNTGLRTCPGCGESYDSWSASSRQDHEKKHSAWEKAVEKFGFCWNPTERDKIKADARNKIEEENLTGEQAAGQYVLVFKSLFSRSLQQSGYAANHPSFGDYAAMLLNQDSWKDETEKHDAYDCLIKKFGAKNGIPKGSYYFSVYTKKEPINNPVDELIKDEPIAAYNNLKEYLTEDDKSDIAQLIRLRAEINKSKL